MALANCKNTEIAAHFRYARKFLLHYRYDAHKPLRERQNAGFFTASLGGLMIDLARFNRLSISAHDFESAANFLAEAKKHHYAGMVIPPFLIGVKSRG